MNTDTPQIVITPTCNCLYPQPYAYLKIVKCAHCGNMIKEKITMKPKITFLKFSSICDKYVAESLDIDRKNDLYIAYKESIELYYISATEFIKNVFSADKFNGHPSGLKADIKAEKEKERQLQIKQNQEDLKYLREKYRILKFNPQTSGR